jgi:protein-S-isoprenylcysteine O-methyltransferase Ste14
MPPLPFVGSYAIVFWALYLATFVPEYLLIRKVRRQRPARQDRGSTRVIMIATPFGVTIAFMCAFALPGATLVSGRAALFWIGIAVLAVGALVRQHCFRMLGASFKPIVDVQSEQVIVERGVYRFLRHPSYAAAVLIFLGIGLVLTNWVSLLVILATVATVYGYRIHVEEAALLSTLGDPYRKYMARTKRIVPFVW